MIILKDKINTILSISKKNELYIDDFSLDVNNKYFYKKKNTTKKFLFKFSLMHGLINLYKLHIWTQRRFYQFYNKINIEKLIIAIDILLVLYNLNNTKKLIKF